MILAKYSGETPKEFDGTAFYEILSAFYFRETVFG